MFDEHFDIVSIHCKLVLIQIDSLVGYLVKPITEEGCLSEQGAMVHSHQAMYK